MYSHSLKMRKSFEALQLSFIKNPYTELGTLFMNPNARGIGGGKLLSFARFLYMSNNLNRFDKEVVVEIRGYKNATGITPFWDKFSSKFFDLNFFDADNSSYIDNHFIGECVPSFPLILDFLPREVGRYCGKPHTTSKLALSLLNSQGFKSNGMVDVLDGGPCLSSKLSKIKVIQNKNQFKVKIGKVNSDEGLSFAFNNSLVDFWATRLFVKRISNIEVLIDRKDARHLGLKEGDSINLSH
ncbi:MAG: hypothetical protein DBW96_01765 [SAR86 cluster bacterium]|uniref:Arginine N-succinyltransferase n=1 Tax=SAR86 cluster bacterium TaxID=2030880 RepID=A0A368BXC5_9GAMM|nr:MAG: hypothetical protein DBW96_01765 [SAR86 cluster bacterium]